MHWMRRAPELSATSRYVSCWITVSPPASGASLLDQARHDEAFAPADGSAGGDLDDVANVVLVAFVVREVTLRDGDDLAVQRVLEAPLDVDGHRLVRLVADDEALHALLHRASSSLWLAMVSSRAISRLATLMRLVLVV